MAVFFKNTNICASRGKKTLGERKEWPINQTIKNGCAIHSEWEVMYRGLFQSQSAGFSRMAM